MPQACARALGLLSGGLDSTLAARLLLEQGVEVRAVHFSTGFCMVDHRRLLGRPSDRAEPARVRNQALRAAGYLGVPVEIVDVASEFLREVVLAPKHGYGTAMNPCIDCRVFMLRKAGEIARERGFDVVFTGEVVGQRPMSQTRSTLELIERESGTDDMLLRPLCARHMPPTRAEREGRIDRERLGTVHGRSRKEQLRMAGEMGITGYPTPGGGCCFLADRNFARRLRDLVSHGAVESLEPGEVLLLKVGRHFRLGYDVKAVFGRDESESTFLKRFAGSRLWTCHVADGRGSFGVVQGEPSRDRARQLAALAARYSRHREREQVQVRLARGGKDRLLDVPPAPEELLRKWLI
jgi:hypothetical protein